MSDRSDGAAVLLDTCALLWFMANHLAPEPKSRLLAAALGAGVFVSPVSAWEIGLLSRPGRPLAGRFRPDPKAWFHRALGGPGIHLAPFTPEIAIDASHLPGDLHADPADRLLIATARQMNLPIVTGDRRILAYAEAGHVGVLAC